MSINTEQVSALFMRATGEKPHEVVSLGEGVVHIETPIAGEEDRTNGFVSLSIHPDQEEGGWAIIDDEQYMQTATRCAVDPDLPEGVRRYDQFLVVRTEPGEQALISGLRLMSATLRGLHEPNDSPAADTVGAVVRPVLEAPRTQRSSVVRGSALS